MLNPENLTVNEITSPHSNISSTGHHSARHRAAFCAIFFTRSENLLGVRKEKIRKSLFRKFVILNHAFFEVRIAAEITS